MRGEETRASGNLLALIQISRLINTSLDPQELCETLVSLLRQTFAYDRASIYTTEAASLFERPEQPTLSDVELAQIPMAWFGSPHAYLAQEPGTTASATNDPSQWRLVRRTTSGDNAAP